MLTDRFYEVWFVGDLDEDGVKKLKEALVDALRRGEKRICFRFYLPERRDLSYLGELRRILLENTRLSVAIEDSDFRKLEEDIKSLEKEVLIIVNKMDALPFHVHSGKLRIARVGGNG